MIIINNEEQFKSLSVIRLYNDGLREERIMTMRCGEFSPASADKAIVLKANLSEQTAKLYFVVRGGSGRKIVVLNLKNPYIFHGHFTVLRMSFEGKNIADGENMRSTVTLKLTKSFLSEKEPIEDESVKLEVKEPSYDLFKEIEKNCAACFSDISESLTWNCIMLDSSMADVTGYQRRRSRLIEKYFQRRQAYNANVFFSVITFGYESERMERLGDKFVTDAREPVERIISTVTQGISSEKRDPFKPIFPLFEEVRRFADLYNIDLNIDLNVIMITDGRSLSPTMLAGFCGKRDELGVKIRCIGGTDGNHILGTIVNDYN